MLKRWGAATAYSASMDLAINLWNVATGEKTTLQESRRKSWALAAMIWDIFTDKRMADNRHIAWVMALTVLPDGRLASGSSDDTIRLWDVATGESTVLESHRNGIDHLAVLPDGRLASASELDKSIRLWDLATEKSIMMKGYPGEVSSLVALRDGRLATTANNSVIKLWDVSNGENTILEGHSNLVRDLALLPNGWLASASDDATIKLWDVVNGTCLTTFENDAGIGISNLTFMHDGRTLVANDQRARLHWLEVIHDEPDKNVWLQCLDSNATDVEPLPSQDAKELEHVQASPNKTEEDSGENNEGKHRPSVFLRKFLPGSSNKKR